MLWRGSLESRIILCVEYNLFVLKNFPGTIQHYNTDPIRLSSKASLSFFALSIR